MGHCPPSRGYGPASIMLLFLRFLLGLRLTFAEHRYIELFYRGSQSSNGGRGYSRTSVRGGGRQPRRKCDEDFAAAAERFACVSIIYGTS